MEFARNSSSKRRAELAVIHLVILFRYYFHSTTALWRAVGRSAGRRPAGRAASGPLRRRPRELHPLPSILSHFSAIHERRAVSA